MIHKLKRYYCWRAIATDFCLCRVILGPIQFIASRNLHVLVLVLVVLGVTDHWK